MSPKLVVEKGSILNFRGDGLICFCDSDLSRKNGNPLLQILEGFSSEKGYRETVYKKLSGKENDGKKNLLVELSSIGRISIGNAAIVNSYDVLLVDKIIFIPQVDTENNLQIKSVQLHKAIRAAFNLASLHNLSNVAIPLTKFKFKKDDVMSKISKLVTETRHSKAINEEDLMEIIISISKEFDNSNLKEITVYR